MGTEGRRPIRRRRREEGRKKEEKIPTVWFTLKKSLHCKSEPTEVHDPKLGTILTKKAGRSGWSWSIANIKDVIHGSKSHLARPTSCSPRSIGSSEFLNPIAHEVVLSESRCELKITGFGGCHEGGGAGVVDASCSYTFVGTLRPGTPGPGGHLGLQSNPYPRRSPGPFADREVGGALRGGRGSGSGGIRRASSAPRRSSVGESGGSCASVSCHKCREQLGKWQALEAHHLSKHAVTELVEGDPSRKIVEIICRPSWLKSESSCGRIERVLKVHNMQKTLARFEEYREMVKIKANKLPKRHTRCLADGNELLRFHGTIVSCSLGANGTSKSLYFREMPHLPNH